MPRNSSSQASQRAASQETPRSQPSTASSGELTELARAAVRFLLMNDFNKVPIRHNDIVKNVTKNHSRSTPQVLKIAAKILKDNFGMRLAIDHHQTNKHYVLVSDLNHAEDVVEWSDETKCKMTLLAIILSFIFMQTNGRWRDQGIEQAKVNNFLKLLKIHVTEPHEQFGDVKKQLEVFVKQRYLEIIRIENTDPPKYEYRWGFRAIEEVPPRAALEFASEMYGRDRIETWAAQFKAVQEYEAAKSARSNP